MTVEIELSREKQQQIALDYLKSNLENITDLNDMCRKVLPEIYELGLKQEKAFKEVIDILENEY